MKRSVFLLTLTVAAMVLPSPFLAAQAEAPAIAVPSAWPTKAPIQWEIISIHPHDPNDTSMNWGGVPNGMSLHGVDLRTILSQAYSFTEITLRDDEVVSMPGWARNARYDVTAHVAPEDVAEYKKLTDMSMEDTILHMAHREASPDMLMMRSLLEERFGLKVHYESKVQPAYALRIDKGGSKLKPAADPLHGGANWSDGHIKGTGLPTQSIASILSVQLKREVLDQTGLSGRFDFELHFLPDNTPPGTDNNNPDLFTAVREQLGVRLESTRAQGLIVVIDKIHPPTPN